MIHTHQPLLYNHCSKENSKRKVRFILLNTSSSAFGIKHFVATILIYLGAGFIFNTVWLHPATGKLQLSLCRASISSGSALSSELKEIAVFLKCLCMLGRLLRVVRWKSLEFSFYLFVCSSQDFSLYFLVFLQPSPQSLPSLFYFPCHFLSFLQSNITSVLSIFKYNYSVKDLRFKAA